MGIDFSKIKAKLPSFGTGAPVLAKYPQAESGKKSFAWLLRPLANLNLRANPRTRILIYAAGGFLALFVVVLIAGIIFAAVKRGGSAGIGYIKPTPGAGVSYTQPPLIPSRYAKDEQVLKIEANLDQIDKNASSVDLRQSYLSLPRIDFNINFKK